MHTEPDAAVIDPPAEVTLFLDRLHANGQRVAQWPLEWVRHPTKPGQWVGVVRVTDDELDRMTRNDCITWLQKNGLSVPPKSSCVFCPYHNRQTWIEMKRRGGSDWQTAVEVDKTIREKQPEFLSYVHRDLIPLTEVKTAEDFGAKQLSFVDTTNAECDSGYCFL